MQINTKNYKIFAAVFLLLTAIFTGGCQAPKSKSAAKNPAQTVSYTIKAPIAGKIIGLIAEPGERISQGQPLFAISDENLDRQVKNLQTQLAKAEAELKRLEQGTVNAAPQGDIQAAQARVAIAQQKAAKMNQLLAQGAVSRNQAQAAQAELAQATAQMQSAAQLAVSSRPASPEAKAAQAKTIEQLKKQLVQAQALQQANEAVSPCTGTIAKVKAANNTEVTQNQEIIIINEEK